MSKPRRSLVPVSKLAWYADNPYSFKKYRGCTRNIAAARAGVNAHKNLAKPTNTLPRLASAALIGVLVLLALMAYLR